MPNNVVGKRINRVDAVAKVTGKAKYAGDCAPRRRRAI